MRKGQNSVLRWLALGLAVVMLSGCASYWSARRADKLIAQGRTDEGINLLHRLSDRNPDDYQLRFVDARDHATAEYMQKAREARMRGDSDGALAAYGAILRFDPQNADAAQGITLIARDRREATQLAQARTALDKGDEAGARAALREILVENPEQADARALVQQMDMSANRAALAEPVLRASMKKPVSLEFRNASIQSVFEVLSQSSGINFIFDKDVKSDLKTTVFARNTTVDDALNLILRTNQLSRKVLNDNTLLIYPATADKDKQYEDLVTRTFYLGNADPKKVQEMLRTLVAPKAMYVDDKLNMLVVRDDMAVIDTIDRLISAYDLAQPEVLLDVDVLEVSTDDMLNIGLQYPDSVSASVVGAAGKGGQLTLPEAQNLNRGNFQLTFPDPLAVLNLKQTSSKAKTLANPRIRVTNHEKAKIMVGDKVPVITTSLNQTSAVSTESVSYLDVGLKLEVQPDIHVNNDVSMSVNLEVSDIVKEVTTTTGLLTYQIGTRDASTVLRLHDGETQVLAGLIKDDQRDTAAHLPGLGKIPLIGRLFSNTTNDKTRSEIVLLITPHVVRSLATPPASALEFPSGTANEVSVHPLRLSDAATYSNTNAALVGDGGAQKPDGAAASSAPVAPAAIPPAPASGVKLDMVSPAQVSAGHEFTVALMQGGAAYDHLEFDLAISQPVTLVRATAVGGTQGLEVSQTAGGVHVKVGKGAGGSGGTLAMVVFKAAAAADAPVTLALAQASAAGGDGHAIPVTLPDTRRIKVLP